MTTPTFPARWSQGNPVLIAETIGCKIWRVTPADGTLAIVKAMKPVADAHDELRGAHYLRWRNGKGAVRLLDTAENAMLLEDAGKMHLSEYFDLYGDRHATEIAAEVLAELLSAASASPPAELQPLPDRFNSLFAKARTDREAGRHTLYVEAAQLAESLLATPRDVRPLHGDLHHDNILLGRRGWLAIDPKGVLGDSAYDAANFFYNPMERDILCADPERVAFMAQTFCRRLNFDPRRLLAYAVAYGCLSASWFAEEGSAKEEQRELGLAETIRRVAISF